MSPRSEELLSSVHDRLAGARDSLTAGHPTLAVSSAYYALLKLAAVARHMQDVREGADYEARAVSDEDAAAVIADAGRFVEAIEQLFD